MSQELNDEKTVPSCAEGGHVQPPLHHPARNLLHDIKFKAAIQNRQFPLVAHAGTITG